MSVVAQQLMECCARDALPHHYLDHIVDDAIIFHMDNDDEKQLMMNFHIEMNGRSRIEINIE